MDNDAIGEGSGGDYRDCARQPPGEAGHLPQQWRGQHGHFPQQVADTANLRVLAGGDDHPLALPIGDQSPGKGHTFAITDHRLDRDCFSVFIDWQRLAGEHRLVYAQLSVFKQAYIRRHLVAGLQQYHVSGYQLLGGQGDELAIALHRGVLGE